MASASSLENGLNIQTKYGNLMNLPPALLGWIVVAVIAGFLVFTLARDLEGKMDRMIDLQQRQVLIMEKLYEKLQSK